MTLPTITTTNSSSDDDSDMFGPPRSSPMRSTRPKVPMISAKFRMREERKRILLLTSHKYELIKDRELNLLKYVCIGNTYRRLTDEVRREKQNKLLANLPKSESINSQLNNNNTTSSPNHNMSCYLSQSNKNNNSCSNNAYPKAPSSPRPPRKYSSMNVDTDLETLDREINALNAAMPLPLIDPEITQGAEQLERIVSRKRTRIEEDNDRLVHEALSHYYPPSPRLLSGIDDYQICPPEKRSKPDLDQEFAFDLNQNQKEFEVILDALRLNSGGMGATPDSCGQAAMLSESGVFHNLVVASLET